MHLGQISDVEDLQDSLIPVVRGFALACLSTMIGAHRVTDHY